MRALNNGAPENRNARSGVRFLGIRSNKCTRAWRQVKRAACRPLPCCDERKERKQAVSGKAACPRVFFGIKRIAASLLRDSREGYNNSKRVAKRRFCQSAPKLPHTYGFWEAGEFAPINNKCALKEGAKRGENAAENAESV